MHNPHETKLNKPKGSASVFIVALVEQDYFQRREGHMYSNFAASYFETVWDM